MNGAKELDRHSVKFLYHMTHVDNLTNIAKTGLRSHNLAGAFDPTDISDPDVQRRRQQVDPIFQRPLHDYVPLYFRARNPMLSVRRDQQSEIAVLYVNRSVMLRPGIVFTDGNAAASSTKFYSDLSDLDSLDWKCLDAEYWTQFEDGKRKRCAEALIPYHVRFGHVRRIVVHNDAAAEIARVATSNALTPGSILIRPSWYF